MIQLTVLQYLMNFAFNLTPCFSSPQEVALYYNSLCISYDCPQQIPHQNQNMFQLAPFGFPYLPEFPQIVKAETQNQRPTDDMEHFQNPQEGQVKLEIKVQQNSQQNKDNERLDPSPIEQQNAQLITYPKVHRQKNLKKNTESNLINNVFSYICSEYKSHRVVLELVGDINKLKIFYIFANNFKRINGKYLNRKNIKAICEIVPKQPHFKMLSKSIKRLMILPMKELRIVLRKLIFNYMRGPESILPLLTSKKICKIAMHEHMSRRRDLCKFMTTMLTDYN